MESRTSDIGIGQLLGSLENFQYSDFSYAASFKEFPYVSAKPTTIISINILLMPANLHVWLLWLLCTIVTTLAFVFVGWLYSSDCLFINWVLPYAALVQSNVPIRWLERPSFQSRKIIIILWLVWSGFLTLAYRCVNALV